MKFISRSWKDSYLMAGQKSVWSDGYSKILRPRTQLYGPKIRQSDGCSAILTSGTHPGSLNIL